MTTETVGLSIISLLFDVDDGRREDDRCSLVRHDFPAKPF